VSSKPIPIRRRLATAAATSCGESGVPAWWKTQDPAVLDLREQDVPAAPAAAERPRSAARRRDLEDLAGGPCAVGEPELAAGPREAPQRREPLCGRRVAEADPRCGRALAEARLPARLRRGRRRLEAEHVTDRRDRAADDPPVRGEGAAVGLVEVVEQDAGRTVGGRRRIGVRPRGTPDRSRERRAERCGGDRDHRRPCPAAHGGERSGRLALSS
jgi:hypothetical protein